MDCAVVMLPGMAFWNKKAVDKSPEEKQEIIDRAQTLAAGLKLDFAQKIQHARKVVGHALDQDVKWAVSYSGGRDSTVLSHLMVHEMGLRIPHVMSNTRMEYPETIKQVNRWYAGLRELGVECHTVFPDDRPNTLWKEIGVPLWSKEMGYHYRKFLKSKKEEPSVMVPDWLREDFKRAKTAGVKVTDLCCDRLKKKPMKKFDKLHGVTGHFTGVRCAESRVRRLAWIQKGALYKASTHDIWIANPLAFWTEQDVKAFMASRKIEVLVPDTLTGGSGCVTCMFGCAERAKEGTPNAMQDLKTRNPRMWKAALDDWGYREVLEFFEIPYE